MFLSQTPSRTLLVSPPPPSSPSHFPHWYPDTTAPANDRALGGPIEGVTALRSTLDAPVPPCDAHRRSAPPIGSASPNRIRETPPSSPDTTTSLGKPAAFRNQFSTLAFETSEQLPGSTSTSYSSSVPQGNVQGQHLHVQPSRAVLLRNVATNVTNDALRNLLEAYGPLHALGAQHRSRGGRASIAAIYYDLRHANAAVCALDGFSFYGRKLEARFHHPSHFQHPARLFTTNGSCELDQTLCFGQSSSSIGDDAGTNSLTFFSSSSVLNHGTLVVFNLDANTTAEEVRAVFSRIGDVKEIRATPNKRHHKFVEFYDVRDAEAALRHLNKTEIGGKKIKIEVSRPGGRSAPAQPAVAVPALVCGYDPRQSPSAALAGSTALNTPILPGTGMTSSSARHEEEFLMSSSPAHSHVSFSTVSQSSRSGVDSFTQMSPVQSRLHRHGSVMSAPHLSLGQTHATRCQEQQSMDPGRTVFEQGKQRDFHSQNWSSATNSFGDNHFSPSLSSDGTQVPAGALLNRCNTMPAGTSFSPFLEDPARSSSSPDSAWHSLLLSPTSLGRPAVECSRDSAELFPCTMSRSVPSFGRVDSNTGESSPSSAPARPNYRQFTVSSRSMQPPPSHNSTQQHVTLGKPSSSSTRNISESCDLRYDLCGFEEPENFSSLPIEELFRPGEESSNEHDFDPTFDLNLDMDLESSISTQIAGAQRLSDSSPELSPSSPAYSSATMSRHASADDSLRHPMLRSSTTCQPTLRESAPSEGFAQQFESLNLSAPSASVQREQYPIYQHLTYNGPGPNPDSPPQTVATPRSEPSTPQHPPTHHMGLGPYRTFSPSYNNNSNPRFALCLEKVRSGADTRTALMIRNIPNKYNQKMLLSALEESHRGQFDFMYLPIDFKNKCNVGYAFINFTNPQYIIPFYGEFHGRKWGKFNSEKVCEISYARIQGKQQLINHFQNSSLMNEDPKCRPVVFGHDGKQEEFPVGSNVRTRRGPSARDAKGIDGGVSSPPFSPGRIRDRGRST